MSCEKAQVSQVDMVTKSHSPQVSAARMPRTAIIPVVNDPKYGLNAGAVSAGVVSLKPLHVLFGVKSPDSKLTYHKAEEFVVAVPKKSQINHLWVTACSVPAGINEIELAGWNELPSQVISTPGIREVPLNLECRKAHTIQLDEPQRCIVIGEVVGVSIDTDLLSRSRSDVVSQYPMHEATDNPHTGLYGPSVLSGEIVPAPDPPRTGPGKGDENGKTFVRGAELFRSQNDAVAMNAVFPMPAYILVTLDEKGRPNALPAYGGLMMSARPSVQIPVAKDSYTYANLKRTGEFVQAITTRELMENYEAMEKNTPDGFKASGFSLLNPDTIRTPGLAECRVNVYCRVLRIEDVPGADYAVVIAERVGASVDSEILELPNIMPLYSEYMYAVMDRGMKRKWGFHDKKNLSVRPLPSWGSRYHGGWWTGPEQYQAGFNFWLFELVQAGYMTEEEFFKIRLWIGWFRREGFPAPEPLWSELKDRLTRVLKMMVWAHRNDSKWHEVHEYLAQFAGERWWSP
ncbi:MAG: flavin reductase [Spirochaetales bacterium]|nr:flavin reductase [Spirochaetales bacterium]